MTVNPPRRPFVRARAIRWPSSDIVPGAILLAATAAAMISANSAIAPLYQSLFALPVTLGAGDLALTKPIILWINDGLMAVFFLFVGLEMKREILRGELSTFRKAALPLAAALGGMVLPALIYAGFNIGGAGARGWGIPMATDIAFALGVLAIVGSRAPLALKVFLTAVAVVDDLGAIAVIALFYTEQLSVLALVAGAGLLGVLAAMNRVGIRRLAPYLLVGAVLWLAVLKSGVHATVAGVALALTIPMGDRGEPSPVVKLEHALKSWVLLAIVPIFAFANAGVSLGAMEGGLMAGLASPVSWGILAGLVVGKPLGVLGFAWVATRFDLAELPAGLSWLHLTAAGMLSGIGFTMSLFVGQLAFGAGPVLESAKIAILVASNASALLAAVALALSARRSAALPAASVAERELRPVGLRRAA